MIFMTDHVKVERYADCWGVATRAADDAKGKLREVDGKKWAGPTWYYATLQGACHKALEIEMRESEDVADLRDAVKALDAAYDRIYKAIDEIGVK